MADESEANQVRAPVSPAKSAAPVDEGLTAWANLVHDNLVTQNGLEIVGRGGGSVHFRFRGQTFAVTVQRVS
jgi:hypothetical protein